MEMWIMIIAMFALMYFLMIRPENKRKKEAQNMRDSLAVGDEITTIGGITGTICAVKENTIVIESGADRGADQVGGLHQERPGGRACGEIITAAQSRNRGDSVPAFFSPGAPGRRSGPGW